MKPNAFGRSCRVVNHPQFDRVASTAGEINQSRLVVENRLLESVGTVSACVPVVLRRWELVPILVVGNELFEVIGKFETTLLDTRGDLNGPHVDCHYGSGRGERFVVYLVSRKMCALSWKASGDMAGCNNPGPMSLVGLSATTHTDTFGIPLLSFGRGLRNWLPSFARRFKTPPNGGYALHLCGQAWEIRTLIFNRLATSRICREAIRFGVNL